MISKIKIYFLVGFLFIISCFLSGCKPMDSDVIYKKCIIDKTQQKLTEGYGIEKDILKLLAEAELSLLESEIIQNVSKKSYLKLNEIVFNDEEILKKITASVETNVDDNFFDLLPLNALEFYSSCPRRSLQ